MGRRAIDDLALPRLERILEPDGQSPGRLGQLGQQRLKARVHLDGGDLGAGLQQSPRQAARTRPHLDDMIVGTDLRQPGDAPRDVQVEQEVLAKRLVGPKVMRLQRLTHRGQGVQAHLAARWRAI